MFNVRSIDQSTTYASDTYSVAQPASQPIRKTLSVCLPENTCFRIDLDGSSELYKSEVALKFSPAASTTHNLESTIPSSNDWIALGNTVYTAPFYASSSSGVVFPSTTCASSVATPSPTPAPPTPAPTPAPPTPAPTPCTAITVLSRCMIRSVMAGTVPSCLCTTNHIQTNCTSLFWRMTQTETRLTRLNMRA